MRSDESPKPAPISWLVMIGLLAVVVMVWHLLGSPSFRFGFITLFSLPLQASTCSAFREKILDISEAQAETIVNPVGIADDF
jgi:hypothetical protein